MRVVPDDPWDAWNELALAEPASVPKSTKMLYAFGWLRTEVNNGGFHQLFLNSAGDVLPDAIAACRATGTDDLADLIERAAALVGDEYPTDRTRRQAVLLALPEAGVTLLNDLSDDYFDLEATHDLNDVMRALRDAP